MLCNRHTPALKERFSRRTFPAGAGTSHSRSAQDRRWSSPSLAPAAAVAVVALASTSASRLPSYTNGYAKWPRINKKPFTSTGPLSSAHVGVKNVYASKRKVGKKYPNGTVIVKTIQRAGRKGMPGQVAVMRKAERTLALRRVRALGLDGTRSFAQGSSARTATCTARANDYVFTKR